MRFTPLPLAGAFKIELERLTDDRGFFARCWCSREFAEHGLNPHLEQCSLSYNARRGTLRGLHWQAHPHEEAKLVRCIRGSIFDVLVDVRPASPSFRRWCGVELDAERRDAVYIPEGFAHGFQTLADHAEILYQISVPYHPGSGRGARWNDPAFAITWPLAQPTISARDAGYPDFAAAPPDQGGPA